ncbi:protein-tyrosine phosphatase-like protein [Spinellus fusiger]|nr:protein-tyrosine phosphatase-like protein [Spinellus fusiger]
MIHTGKRTGHNGSPLGRMLSLIDSPSSPIRFLILDCPTESTLGYYIEEFIQLEVATVVRCCQPTYNASRLLDQNIQVVDLPFKDGGVPPPQVVREWLSLLEHTRDKETTDSKPTIAVHCVAGLGRAPVLVAIALTEMGSKPLDTIEFIREKRRGAFNKPQIAYLETYKRSLKPKSSGTHFFRSSLERMFKFGTSKPIAPVSQQI